jgi:hypothetical protein
MNMLVRVRVRVLVRGCAIVRVRVRMWRRDFSPGGRSFDQVELRCRHPRPQHPLGTEFVLIDAQAAESAAEVLEREPRVEQGAQDHVARGAIETVEIQQLHREVTGRPRRSQTLDLT